MAIAITLQEYLSNMDVDYNILKHSHTEASMQTAQMAHIPGEQLAKSVVLEDENGRYLMAVIPSNRHVSLGKLHQQYQIRMGLATEAELGEIFTDCELGAVPPVGDPYGIDVIMDDSLAQCSDVYFEAGDHVNLVHLSGESFQRLMNQARHASFIKSY